MATPSAPTNLVENNVNNTVSFTMNPLYTIYQHEYSLNAGGVFTACTSTLVSIPQTFHNLDDIQIRVKAIGVDTASVTLNNKLGYLSPLIPKLPVALQYDIIIVQGQSNAEGVTNNVNNLTADGISWENEEAKDWQTEGNANFKGSMIPAFMNRHFELTGRKCIVVFTSKGGTALQYIPESDVNGNWSESGGTLRYDSAKEALPCIESFNQNTAYNVNNIIVLFDQGENDAGSIALGYTSTPENYLVEFKSLAQYNSDAFGMSQLYVSLLGSLVDYDDETEMTAIREEGQRQASIESSLITVGYEDATLFPSRGWMHDGVHHERQGQDSKGTCMAEVFDGADAEPNIDVPTTEFLDTSQYITYLQLDEDFKNSVIGADEYTLEGGASLSPSASRFVYGEGLQILGDGGFLKIAQSPIKHDSYTIACRVKIPSRFDNGNNCLLGDMSNLPGNIVSGCALAGFNGALLTFWVNNQGIQWAGADSDLIIDNDWHDVVVSVDFTLLVPKATLSLDGVSYGAEDITTSPYVSDWAPPTQEFTIGCCNAMGANSSGQFADATNAFDIDDVRIDNVVWTQSEVELYTSSAGIYDLVNTPVTPDAPVITEGGENSDTNTITLTPTAGLEVSLKGGDYSDTVSPYTVTYETYPRYEIGEIEFRVKAVGVNPASDTTANTIAFTECDQVDYTDIVYCSNDLNGVDLTPITVRLWSKIVQYKTNVVIKAEDLTFTPDSLTGKTIMSLPDTEDMIGEHEYRFDFGNNSWYFAQVPKSDEQVSFWDLEPSTDENDCSEESEVWDLSVKQNIDCDFEATFKDEFSRAIDLTGATIIWEVKDNYSDEVATITARSDEATGSYIELYDQELKKGEYRLHIDKEDTLLVLSRKAYTHGCYIIDSNGNNIFQWEGSFKVEQTTPR